jgi:hypothetical protein
MMIERRWLAFGSMSALVLVMAASAWPQGRAPTIVNPDPAIQAAASANRASIDRLVGQALDTARPAAERLQAVNSLAGLHFDYLLANADVLVRDADPDVSLAAVMHIAGQIAMLPAGHGGPGGASTPSATQTYHDRVVAESLRILRLALDNPGDVVRDEAARVLSSRGDVQGLARIQSQVDGGQLAAKSAVEYFSLAPLDVSAPYIAPFLTSRDTGARTAAVGTLSYDPKFTTPIRAIALDAQTDDAVRSAALPGLATTDKEFSSYGIALAQNKALSAQTRAVAVESMVKYTLKASLSEGAVRTMEPLLSETATEIKSDRAMKAVQDLKSTYGIQ